MTSLEAALRQIHTDLTEAHVSFALVGGLAVSARTEPRFTRDADLAAALASDAEVEALIHSLRTRDYGIEAVVEQQAVGRLATVRLTLSRVRTSECNQVQRPTLWRACGLPASSRNLSRRGHVVCVGAGEPMTWPVQGTSILIMPSCRDVMNSSPSRLRPMCRSARAIVASMVLFTSS